MFLPVYAVLFPAKVAVHLCEFTVIPTVFGVLSRIWSTRLVYILQSSHSVSFFMLFSDLLS